MRGNRTFVPDDDEIEQARELLKGELQYDQLPETAEKALRAILQMIADGECPLIESINRALTVQEAAAVTNTSPEHIRERLDDGELERTGGKIALSDLLRNEAQRREQRQEALDELVRQAQSLGLYGD